MNKVAQLVKHFSLNPKDFIQKMIIEPYNLGANRNFSITSQQEDGIEAIRRIVTAKMKRSKGDKMTVQEQADAKKLGVSIMSGKGNGKDGLVAMLIIWFIYCFPYPKIPCTSVSADQISVVLWGEITKWLTHSPARSVLTLQSKKLFRKDLSNPEDVGHRWLAFPRTANPKSSVEEQVETLAGLHEEFMMIVADECSGIPDAVFDPLEGTLTGIVNFLVLIFNPTRTKGYAIRSQYESSEDWIALRWDSRDSPLANKEEHERIKKRYGTDSNPWRVRVLGLPPLVDENTTIPYDWIQAAIDKELDPAKFALIIKGMDCGAGGDYSVIVTRKGGKVYPIKRNNSPDSRVLINWAGTDIDDQRPDKFRVDTVGLGWAVEGALRENKGSIIEGADARRKPDDPDRFLNKRAEMYWNLRDVFEKGIISIPNDQDLIDSLSATKHEYSNGRIKIIDKKKIKEELGHSPDEADALAITYYESDDHVCRNDREEEETGGSDVQTNEYDPYDYIRT